MSPEVAMEQMPFEASRRYARQGRRSISRTGRLRVRSSEHRGSFGGYAFLNVDYNRLFAFRTPLMSVADLDRSLFGAVSAQPFPGGDSPRRRRAESASDLARHAFDASHT